MNFWLWSLYFLPVSGALRTLREVKLEAELGGSITIECPLPEIPKRVYLCRVMTTSGVCTTVVSNTNFIKEEYRSRVTLQPCPDKNLFLVEVTELTKSDSGVYACGTGRNTGRGKTQQVTLHVNSEYNPFWEEMPTPEPPRWFHRLLHLALPSWAHMPADPTSEFISKVTTPVQRTQTPPDHTLTPITHHLQDSRVSSVTASKTPTLLPSTTASKTSARMELLESQTASYNYRTRQHRQRAFNRGLSGGMEDQGFHILIPAILGLILLVLLGMMIKRSIQRRKAFSRRVRRPAVRMRALEASQPRPAQRPRSQNNIYSACPRRVRGADAAGEQEAPLPDPRATEPQAGPQVSEALWLPGSGGTVKTSCESLSFHHQPPAKEENADSEDYINIPHQTHLPGCSPRLGSLCQ
ncbi:fas apoptotic inhibitory molecule 3 [Choloepus didactylus]|uniref:fas apoptotic inhibitory molecule 3 n=1 Tax=Choloepus didactylus TaxID=27675 RepID=UPI00189F193C|nr:fas apoptotic inhibitory molecule 3 [Choloepus didactylus]